MSLRSIQHKRHASIGLIMATAFLLGACGGQVPFSAQMKFAGQLPPPPPPPEPPAEPTPPPRVEIRDNKIEIHDKILFEVRKAEIREESFGLMEEIAEVLKKNPQIKKVSIEGHTDSVGSDQYNQDLSDKRSKAVMQWLVDHGVEADRLEAQGHGETQPIADNETDEGKEKNRRVEFNILEQEVTQTKVEITHDGKEKVVDEKVISEAASSEESAKPESAEAKPAEAKPAEPKPAEPKRAPGLTKSK
ncbi:MAG: OmpA family protein [Polyangiaceae bacterium]|nr:OmpA family protein [Polyangiaceae bacterium]